MNKEFPKRLLRLYIGCLCPIFLTVIASIFAIIGYVFLWSRGIEDTFNFGFSPLFALSLFLLAYMAIPAMIYSSLMEFVINPKISNHQWVVFISIFLGFLFIYLVIVFFTSSMGYPLSKVVYGACVVVACFVGCFSGIWIRFIYIWHIGQQKLPRICVVIICFVSLYFLMSTIVGIWLFVKMTNNLP